MTDCERLNKLLKEAFILADENYGMPNVSQVTDYLLTNDVIVPSCKVEDKVYALWETSSGLHICSSVVTEIRILKRDCRRVIVLLLERMDYSGRKREYGLEEFGKTWFLSYEEAEKALKEREENARDIV